MNRYANPLPKFSHTFAADIQIQGPGTQMHPIRYSTRRQKPCLSLHLWICSIQNIQAVAKSGKTSDIPVTHRSPRLSQLSTPTKYGSEGRLSEYFTNHHADNRVIFGGTVAIRTNCNNAHRAMEQFSHEKDHWDQFSSIPSQQERLLLKSVRLDTEGVGVWEWGTLTCMRSFDGGVHI